MRTLVMGDVHGALKAVEQVLNRANYDPTEDRIIFLGDVADGWPETAGCVDLFLDEIGDLVHLRGNHDNYTIEWMLWGNRPAVWLEQGGRATIDSYRNRIGGVSRAHKEFFSSAKMYHEENGKLYVHAGINPDIPLESHRDKYLMWNRDLFNEALEKYYNNDPTPITDFEEVYIGHTSLAGKYGVENKPIQGGEVWMIDTGAGWHGKLSVMDVETKEYWQSDPVPQLYPDHPHARF